MKTLLPYNLRDLGGMPTADGHCVRHNRFLRSANLQKLSMRGRNYLTANGLTTIIDLRTPIEIEEKPDVQINGVENIAVPILSDQSMGITREHGADPIQAIRSMRQEPDKLRAMLPDFCKLYEGMVTSPSSQAGLAQALNIIIDCSLRGECVLYHCTVGKDRTGILSALILSLLGVDRATILRDYVATNRAARREANRKGLLVALMTRSISVGKIVRSLFLANPHWLEHALNTIDEQYGGVQEYATRVLNIPQERLLAFSKSNRTSLF